MGAGNNIDSAETKRIVLLIVAIIIFVAFITEPPEASDTDQQSLDLLDTVFFSQ